MAIRYKSKHQGKYGASLQGPKFNMDNMFKLQIWPNVFGLKIQYNKCM